jgi:hypothetical protein
MKSLTSGPAMKSDLSDFVYPASLAVAKGECDRGIFVDGVGYGSALIANKINGIYAAACQDSFLCQACPPAHRLQRLLLRRQDYRGHDGRRNRQDLAEHGSFYVRKVTPAGGQSQGDQRQALRASEIGGLY